MTEPAPHRDEHADGLLDTYVEAVVENDMAAACSTLSPGAVFQSPFNTWPPRDVPSVYRARARAFKGLVVETVIRDHSRAVIFWRATASADGHHDAKVEAAEMVEFRRGAIDRVDVFLRPASVLDAVHRAMADGWPC